MFMTLIIILLLSINFIDQVQEMTSDHEAESLNKRRCTLHPILTFK